VSSPMNAWVGQGGRVDTKGLLLCGVGLTFLAVCYKLYASRPLPMEGDPDDEKNRRPKQIEERARTTGILALGPGNYPAKTSFSARSLLFPRINQKYTLASEEVVHSVRRLASNSDCYLIMEVASDEQEAEVRHLLDSTNLYSSGLNPLKVLFCSTTIGRAHMVKQLGVEMHIDTSIDVLEELCRPRPWVDKLVHIKTGEDSRMNGVYEVDHISQIFATS